MNVYQLNDLLRYTDCSYKVKHQSNNKLFDSRDLVTCRLVADVFTECIDKLNSGKEITESSIKKRFNLSWHKIKNKITYPISVNDYVIFYSYMKRIINHLSSYNKIDVICNNKIFEYHVNEFIIRVPLTIFKCGIRVYIYYIDTESYKEDKPGCYKYLGPILIDISKQIFSGTTYSLNPIIYRSQLLRCYNCSENKFVEESLINVLKSMSSDIYYATVSDNCKLCKSKEKCPWYE